MGAPPVIPAHTYDEENARQFARDFPDLKPNQGNRGKGKEVVALERRVRDLHVTMRAMEPPACVIVNMNPFPLTIAGPLHDGIYVPPCPEGEEYAVKVIKDYGISVADEGDAKYVPHAEPPMKLAFDFERIFGDEAGYGGVFYYPGSVELLKKRETKVQRIIDAQGNIENVTIAELFDRARTRQLVLCEKMYAEAELEWNKPNGQRNIITERHKRSALVLLRAGKISEKPVWISLTRTEANIGEKCPSCTKQLQKKQVKCDSCDYIVDIERAVELSIVERDNPQLKRLGVDRLIELRFSDEEIAWLCPGYDPETYAADAKEAEKQASRPAPRKKAEAKEADGKKADGKETK